MYVYRPTRYANQSGDYPDVQLFMASITDAGDCGEVNAANLGLQREAYDAVYGPLMLRDAVTCLPLVLRPRSRGAIRIASPSMDQPPVIDPQYLSRLEDARVLVSHQNLNRIKKYRYNLFEKFPQYTWLVSKQMFEYR